MSVHLALDLPGLPLEGMQCVSQVQNTKPGQNEADKALREAAIHHSPVECRGSAHVGLQSPGVRGEPEGCSASGMSKSRPTFPAGSCPVWLHQPFCRGVL